MSKNLLNDPINKPCPPPPPPDMGDGPDVPRGNRYGTNGRCSTYADFQNALGGHPQIPDVRRVLGSASASQTPYGPHYLGTPPSAGVAYPHGRPATTGLVAAQSSMTFTQLKRFTLNQAVHVNIEGQGWLLGTVVAFVHAVRAVPM